MTSQTIAFAWSSCAGVNVRLLVASMRPPVCDVTSSVDSLVTFLDPRSQWTRGAGYPLLEVHVTVAGTPACSAWVPFSSGGSGGPWKWKIFRWYNWETYFLEKKEIKKYVYDLECMCSSSSSGHFFTWLLRKHKCFKSSPREHSFQKDLLVLYESRCLSGIN